MNEREVEQLWRDGRISADTARSIGGIPVACDPMRDPSPDVFSLSCPHQPTPLHYTAHPMPIEVRVVVEELADKKARRLRRAKVWIAIVAGLLLTGLKIAYHLAM